MTALRMGRAPTRGSVGQGESRRFVLLGRCGKGRSRWLAARRRRSGRLVLAVVWLAFAGQAAAAAGAQPQAGEAEAVGLLSADELETLVAPVALYPDDLLALVLPASTYPLQVVQAARFLEARKKDRSAEPGADWNEAIIALLNYPEAVELLNDDLDWTWRLGEAVLAQEESVIAAVSAFREKAKLAGNLESDSRQKVVVEDGAIRIRSTSPTRIHVPYYEPAEVVAHRSYRVYHYYPRAYPVYYFPYHRHHRFHDGLFWGVTSAFSIGWGTGRLHWHHYGFHDHPYFGHRYHDPFYHRHPHLYLNLRKRNHRHRDRRHRDDNRWRPDGRRHGVRPRVAQHRERWTGERRHTLGRDPGRGEDRRRRDRSAEDRDAGRHLADGNRVPGGRDAAAEDPAAPAVRPIARTLRPAAVASRNGSQPTIHAPTQVRLLPRGTAQRPHPLGRGGGAGEAAQVRQRPAGATAWRSAPARQQERPLRRAGPRLPEQSQPSASARQQERPIRQPRRGHARPLAGNPVGQPAQVRRQPNPAHRPVAPAAGRSGRWTPGSVQAIPRPRPPVQPKAQPTPRPSPTPQIRPGAGALSPEALSKQMQQPPPQARRTRKDVDHR